MCGCFDGGPSYMATDRAKASPWRDHPGPPKRGSAHKSHSTSQVLPVGRRAVPFERVRELGSWCLALERWGGGGQKKSTGRRGQTHREREQPTEGITTTPTKQKQMIWADEEYRRADQTTSTSASTAWSQGLLWWCV